MKRIVLSLSSAIVLTGFVFGGESIAPISSEPVAEVSFWYAGGAIIYHRTYSGDKHWFNESIATQDETGGLTAIVGYNYNDYLAFEGRVSGTFFSKDYSDSTNYGIYVKPYYKFIDDEHRSTEEQSGFFSVYGLLGLGVVKVKAADGAIPAHQEDIGKTILDESSFQWGLGLSYTFVDLGDKESIENIHDGDITIYLEYLNLISDADIYSRLYNYDSTYYDKLSQDSISAGVTYRF